jgi:nucleoid-associated protein YgaU
VRHETWLGIFVVILLVFALGFLVYQKVERHERQLTQAAIAPRTAEPGQPANEQPVAAAATDPVPPDFAAAAEPSGGLEPVASDPLVTAAGTEPSPFGESAAEPLAEPSMEPAVEPAAEGAPTFAFSEPAEEPAPDLLAMNAGESESPVLGELGANPVADQSAVAASADVGLQLPIPEEPPIAAAEFPETPAAGDESVAALTAGEDSPLMLPTENAESPAVAEATPLPADSAPAEAAAQLPDFSFGTDGASGEVQAEPVTPAEPSPFDSPATAGESAEPLPEPMPEPAGEPELLAMADPQQEPAFGADFNPGGLASNGEPPASPAFRAVTRPAAGGLSGARSGSSGTPGADRDGRFSLAAFNSQNGAVQPGVDDGEKHPSVIVQNGENYSKISKRVYGTTRYFSALAVFNQHRIPNPNSMRPGMIVLTPDAKLLEQRYPQLFADRQPKAEEPAGFLLLEDGSPAYRVGARETLSEISERFLGRSSRWVEIYQLNRSVLPDPNTLKPGLVLALPEDATEVQLVP